MAAMSAADTYERDDLLAAGEGVFGKGAEGFASIIEKILSEQGEPNAYIAGREAAGAVLVEKPLASSASEAEEIAEAARLAGVLAQRGLDGLVVTSLVNMRYLSGFSGSNGALLVPGPGAAGL